MGSQHYTRREWLKKLGTAGLGLSLFPGLTASPQGGSSGIPYEADQQGYKHYFGDIHNHNAVGYARGGLRRSFEIAQNQRLDFYALTPQAYWHDIEEYEGGIEQKWLRGFEVTKNRWPDLLHI